MQLRQQLLQQQGHLSTASTEEQGQGAHGCVSSSSCGVLVQDAVVQLLHGCGAELPGYKKDAKSLASSGPPVVQ
jgi:hypothetical protein